MNITQNSKVSHAFCVLVALAASVVLAACSSSSGKSTAVNWSSKLLATCSGKPGAPTTLSIQSSAVISGANLDLTNSCLLEIDQGSLTIDRSTLKVSSLGIVLSQKARLSIESSKIFSFSPSSSVSLTSSGGGQVVTFSRDNIHLDRGILVELGFGSTPNNGVKELAVLQTSINAPSPDGLGIDFITKGPSKFIDDTFSTKANGGIVAVKSASLRTCTITRVKGISGHACLSITSGAQG